MKKILIVDDEFLIRYSLSQMLNSASVDVTSVTTGSEAFKEIASSTFDLCCLDIHLPDVSGIEIMKRIRQVAPNTKIIMMTGGEVSDGILADIRKNSELLLSKPFDLFKVKRFVDRILASVETAFEDEIISEANDKTFEYRLTNDQRREERRTIARRARYAIVVPPQEKEREAEIIDISEGGMCLMTTYLLSQGEVIRICNNKSEHCTGTVRWSMRTGSDNFCRTGIQFTKPVREDFPSCFRNTEDRT